MLLTTHYLLDQAVPKKIARLFLVSDILHNASASVPNASSYRSHLPMCKARPVWPASQSTCISANWPRLEASLSLIWRWRGGAWRAGGRIGLSLRVAVFHRHFLVSLPEIFVSLHDTYKELTSRMGIETMKQQVTKVLHIWQAWSLFPLSYVARLERTLLYGSPDADAADKAEARAHATITQSQPQP